MRKLAVTPMECLATVTQHHHILQQGWNSSVFRLSHIARPADHSTLWSLSGQVLKFVTSKYVTRLLSMAASTLDGESALYRQIYHSGALTACRQPARICDPSTLAPEGLEVFNLCPRHCEAQQWRCSTAMDSMSNGWARG